VAFIEEKLCRSPLDAAARAVLEAVDAGDGGYACFCNVHLWTLARRQPLVRAALSESAMLFADGTPIAWLYSRGRGESCARVAGANLMWRVLELGRDRDLSHFFYGSTERVLRCLIERVRRDIPGVKVAGALSPPFCDITTEHQHGLVDEVGATNSHVIWCALGAPRQEEWMFDHARRLAPAFLLGVGAAFEFIAETKRRAPEALQMVGLEWFHRLLSEPRRLAPRYALTNVQFVCDLLRDSAGAVVLNARRNA
jgi:N-acetylglucosaminyldiphosphoundecaprenol N-acetyl-beta-D-mannosaminyltransferase